MTVDELKKLGANVEEGIARCAGNEAFYLRLVPKALDEGKFQELDQNVREKRFQEAFEAAHALKGVLANLSLTPIYEPICEITELLRAKKDVSYEEILERIRAARESFADLI